MLGVVAAALAALSAVAARGRGQIVGRAESRAATRDSGDSWFMWAERAKPQAVAWGFVAAWGQRVRLRDFAASSFSWMSLRTVFTVFLPESVVFSSASSVSSCDSAQ